jgi:predicted nucleic acid-binding protein
VTILIDSNIPMYLVGATHPNKARAERRLQQLVSDDERLVTDAEVLQEILHRYTALNRLDAIEPAFDAVRDVSDEVLDVTEEIVLDAKLVVLGGYRLSARDAIHVAVMKAHGIRRVLSFDTGFDGYPGIERVA